MTEPEELAAAIAGYLLTETDAPFTKIGDRPTAPIDVRETVEALANLPHMPPEVLARNIHSNLRTLLGGAVVPVDH